MLVVKLIEIKIFKNQLTLIFLFLQMLVVKLIETKSFQKSAYHDFSVSNACSQIDWNDKNLIVFKNQLTLIFLFLKMFVVKST